MVNYAIFNSTISENIFCRAQSVPASKVAPQRCVVQSFRVVKLKIGEEKKAHTHTKYRCENVDDERETKSVFATFGSATLWHYRL